MTARLAGKVALITGAARGIGRAQAVRFAQEGADIIALDVCGPVDTVVIPSSTPDDLDETARLVSGTGARIVTEIVDIRDPGPLKVAVDRGVTAFGGLDIVCATAGITSRGFATEMPEATWQTMLDVNLSGVWRTCKVTAPHLIARERRIGHPGEFDRGDARTGGGRPLHSRQARCRRFDANFGQ